MKKIVTILTLFLGALAHASSPAPAVSAFLEATPEGAVRLDLRADGIEGYRVDLRQIVASPTGGIETVPVVAIGLGPGEGRTIVPPRIATPGAVVRVRYEVRATGMRTGRTFLSIADRAFSIAPDGKLRPLTVEEERRLASPAITLTGEPVPAAEIERAMEGHRR